MQIAEINKQDAAVIAEFQGVIQRAESFSPILSDLLRDMTTHRDYLDIQFRIHFYASITNMVNDHLDKKQL